MKEIEIDKILVKWLAKKITMLECRKNILDLFIVSGSLGTTTLKRSTDGFMSCKIVECCKIGPIINEKYCPECGKKIIRNAL